MRARLRLLATLIGIVGTAAVAIWFLFHLTGDPPRTPHEPIGLAPPPVSVPVSSGGGAVVPSTNPNPNTGTNPSSSTTTHTGTGTGTLTGAVAGKLGSANETVDTQLVLLREGRDADFRSTFLPSVTVTPEAIAACKKRIDQVPVKPDWEVAEDAFIDGHAVRRVSMFGKSMTGFHDIGGKWLADAVWCVPTGLP